MSVYLPPESVDRHRLGRHVVLAAFVLTAVIVSLAAMVVAPGYGRPTSWILATMPAIALLFAFFFGSNLFAWLRAMRVVPFVRLRLDRAPRRVNPMLWRVTRGVALPPGVHGVLFVEHHVAHARAGTITSVSLVLAAGGREAWRVTMPASRSEFDWEDWVRREFAGLSGLRTRSLP